MSESACTVTAPAELNVSDPKFAVPAEPISIEVPLKEALPPTLSTSVAVSLRVIAPVPIIVKLFVTVRLVPVASVIAPAEVNDRLLTVLVLASCVSESSCTTTAPDEFNVNDPKFAVPAGPILIEPPLKEALAPMLKTSVAVSLRVIAPVAVMAEPFVTVRLMPVASVMAPDEVNDKLLAEFVPVSSVPESSCTVTAPSELNVSEPKFAVPAEPMLIELPLKEALTPTLSTSVAVSLRVIAPVAFITEPLVTVRLVPVASVMAPAELKDRLLAVLALASCVSESSCTVTAPDELNVSDPKFAVPAGPMLIELPLKEALVPTLNTSVPVTLRVIAPVAVMEDPLFTVRLAPVASVISPNDVNDRLFAV